MNKEESKKENMTNNDLIISTSDTQSEWYETEPGKWSTSSNTIDRIEMGIQEIIWRLRKSPSE